MATVAYPNELMKRYWDKNKPVLAKTKSTGIGDALNSLEKAHKDIKWDNYEPQAALASVDDLLARWPKIFADDLKPVADMAKDVEKLAKKSSGEFSKSKTIPKSAAKVADTVAAAAKSFADALLDYEGEQAKAIVAKRSELVGNVRKVLKPMMTKSKAKIDGLLKDIPSFARNPTKENYWKHFSGDSNARGYTTACKNWDQFLSEFPELRDQCFKGKAMDVFFPGMEDYGANWAEAEFESKVNSKTGKTGDAAYRQHAIIMLKQGPNIKKFKAAIEKLLTLLE